MTRLATAKAAVATCIFVLYAVPFAMPVASRTTSAASALLLIAIACAGVGAYRQVRSHLAVEGWIFVCVSLLLASFELASLAFGPAEVVGWIAASAYIDAISWVSIIAAVLMLAFVARILALRDEAAPADARAVAGRE